MLGESRDAHTSSPGIPASTPAVSSVAPVVTVVSKVPNSDQTDNNNNNKILIASSDVSIEETNQNETHVATVNTGNTKVLADKVEVLSTGKPLDIKKSNAEIGATLESSSAVAATAAVQNSSPSAKC
ncbi:unnamed protein product [[Candida] boidinii]|nr:unnamed protein product [[Candida] boidinii]